MDTKRSKRDRFLMPKFLLKGKWQQNFLLSHLKGTLKIIHRSFHKIFISVLLWEILSRE